MTTQPTTDDLPTTQESEARIAADAPAALVTLRRLGAMDLADVLGIGGVA